MNNESTVKIQIALDKDKFDYIIEKTGVKRSKDILNNALTLLTWAIEEEENGKRIGSIDEEHKMYKEVLLPILDNVKTKREKKEAVNN
jgi:hypothetical protein